MCQYWVQSFYPGWKPMILNGKKFCPKCGYYKAIEAFHKERRSSDGLASHCRWCRKEYKKGRIK